MSSVTTTVIVAALLLVVIRAVTVTMIEFVAVID